MQNVPSAYLVPSAVYEKMTEIIEEYHLSKAVDTALASNEKSHSYYLFIYFTL